MNPERIKNLIEDYGKALKRFKESLAEDLSKGSIVIDGTIQRFEFCFELGWKALKALLEFQGVEASTPRATIKEAFRAKLIENGEGWIDMLEDRNKTPHIYDEAQARRIYDKIKNSHARLLVHLGRSLQKLRLE